MDLKNLTIKVEITNLDELQVLLQKAADQLEQIKNFLMQIDINKDKRFEENTTNRHPFGDSQGGRTSGQNTDS